MARRTKRTSISIAPDLKARMAAVGEHVNWSAIACRAFEHELADFHRRQDTKLMHNVLERLRVSRQTTAERYVGHGLAAGKTWARTVAEARELERLEEFWDAEARELFFQGQPGLPFSHADVIANRIRCDSEDDWSQHTAADFWETIGVADPSNEFMQGFCTGAIEVWNQVKIQL